MNQITIAHDDKELHVHIRGVFGDDGENEGVLSVSARLDCTEDDPPAGMIVVGSPGSSPLIDGYTPSLGCFSCGIDGAELLIKALQNAVAGVKAGLSAKRAAT